MLLLVLLVKKRDENHGCDYEIKQTVVFNSQTETCFNDNTLDPPSPVSTLHYCLCCAPKSTVCPRSQLFISTLGLKSLCCTKEMQSWDHIAEPLVMTFIWKFLRAF
uniref:Uncharacterized protein n=1 Tax=Opuntia streptacantha TaxID=393608 RepID=A0A7C8YKG7_OPUST